MDSPVMTDKTLPVFEVQLSPIRVQAENPVQAALIAANVAGQKGADKFLVRSSNGVENQVDLGLLHDLGVLVQEQPETPTETESEQAVEIEEVTE